MADIPSNVARMGRGSKNAWQSQSKENEWTVFHDETVLWGTSDWARNDERSRKE
jgi:hypothetical protein